jgi:predicted ATPase with chaperone activity
MASTGRDRTQTSKAARWRGIAVPTRTAGAGGRRAGRGWGAPPDADGRRLLTQAVQAFGLSARGYARVLKVARTIADLGGSDHVRSDDVAEALQYRLAQ